MTLPELRAERDRLQTEHFKKKRECDKISEYLQFVLDQIQKQERFERREGI